MWVILNPSVLYEYEDAVDALKRDYPLCTKGLAVAISNAQEAADRFATAKYNYSDWFKAEDNNTQSLISVSALNRHLFLTIYWGIIIHA